MYHCVTSAEAETEYFFTKYFFQDSAVQASAKVEKKGKQKLFMNLIGQSAVICLSFSGLCRMLL
jgi:hypothetical protein